MPVLPVMANLYYADRYDIQSHSLAKQVIMTNQPTAYDVVPYDSKPFVQSRPAHLSTIGRLFGMQPADLQTARVLEIGCASGGNLLPLAASHPDATFLGIDTSSTQIAAGQKSLDELGLKNIELRQLSITELAAGEFDYIICHGVLSWVDETIQHAILHQMGRLLAENGIAYLSYNTLPGWNMVRSLREMMLYHTSRYENPAEKAAQARSLLNFLRDNASGDPQSPYRQLLTSEINLLAMHPDSYFLHDHLEQHNIPHYFHQVIGLAQAAGLQYLGDAQLQTMFPQNFTQAAQDLLHTTQDILLQEQYMDFLSNRRFRMTLLCRAGVSLNRTLNLQTLDDYYLQNLLQPGERTPDDPENAQIFHIPSTGARLVTTHPVSAALLDEMVRRAHFPARLETFFQAVRTRMPAVAEQELRDCWNDWSLKTLAKGMLVPHATAPLHVASLSERPEAWFFARAQLRYQPWVTNLMHELLSLDLFGTLLLPLLDGSRTREELCAAMTEYLEQGRFTLNLAGQPVTDPRQRQEHLEQLIANQLQIFVEKALLVG